MSQKRRTLDSYAEEAISRLSDVIATTLGPDGHTVLIIDGDKPFLTKDGVTVAKNFVFNSSEVASEEDRRVLNSIVKLVVEMSRKTDFSVGDGTTSTLIFAGELYKRLYELKQKGYNLRDLIDGVRFAVNSSKAGIAKCTYPVKTMDEIERIAFLSANNDEDVALLLREIFENIGKTGVITFNKSDAPKSTEVRYSRGFRFPAGYASKLFVNNFTKKTVEFENPFYLVTDFEFAKPQELLQVVNLIESEKRPLVIICERVSRDVLLMLADMREKGVLQSVVIQAPYQGIAKTDFYEDVCVFTGASFVTVKEHYTFPLVHKEQLGQSVSMEAGPRGSVLVGSPVGKEIIKKHVEDLQELLKATADDVQIEMIYNRISRFSAGAAEVIIGGSTESEVRERRYRLEDALRACNNAFVFGYVPGGGLVYLHIQKHLKGLRKQLLSNEAMLRGFDAFCDSLECILDILIRNSDISYERFHVKNIKDHVKKKFVKNIGFDFKKKEFRDFLGEEKIIEPAGIAQEVVDNSFSIVSLLINTKEYI